MEDGVENRDGTNNPTKRRTKLGAKKLQLSESNGVSTGVIVGRIVEKGVTGKQSLAPPPIPSLLPFPVPRHRSHGPHWAPVQTYNGDQNDDNTQNEDLMTPDTVATFAEPIRRKEKKALDFSRWRELIANDDPSTPHEKSKEKHIRSKDLTKINNTVAENLGKFKNSVNNTNGTLQKRIPSAENVIAQDVTMSEKEHSEVKDEIVGEVEVGLVESSKGYIQDDRGKHMNSTFHSFLGDNFAAGNKEESTTLESQIDDENRARLESMSADEIAEAQAEILGKMNPAVIEALKKRGQNKMNLPKKVVGIQQDTSQTMNKENIHMKPNDDNSPKIKEERLAETNRTVNVKSSSWDIWSEKVEAARGLRFSLDGNVVYNEFPQLSGDKSTHIGYTTVNVSERDFLRTEGDPAAAGYTIIEAIALTRSVIPSQRVLAMHLLASVLDKAIHNISQNQIDHNVNNSSSNFSHWGAVWAYALGPESELALSLRMALDDNHKSVVLATAKVIQCLLSCDINESYFDISEKLTVYPRDINTAPIFRSRPEIHDGFIRGGFWKYSAKPSNIFPFGEDNNDVEDDEEEHTIKDDMVVVGQDFVAGLVRMGVLQRICYLLESDPSAALEEGLLSILVAIARHSFTCASAIIKCERLLQTIVSNFTIKDPLEARPSKIKSVSLLKVLARSEKKNCIAFISNGVFQSTTWHLYQCKFSLDQWIKFGSDKCKFSMALLIEQLRFWKVCMQYRLCISNFSDLFPSLCMWLTVPNIVKLVENNVLSEFAAITEELFLVLGTMSRTLPNIYANTHSPNQISDISDEDSESWCWAHVGPMVDFATKWISLVSNPFENKIFEKPMLRVISAVMVMLSGVLDRLIPEDTNNLPWLPEFVPKIGLGIINNGLLSSLRTNGTENTNDPLKLGSFIENLCLLRQQNECDISIASSSCLGGLIKVMLTIDKLIELAKPGAHVQSLEGQITTIDGQILAGGMIKFCNAGVRRVLNTFMNLISCEWKLIQSIELFGRGGPAPGIGVGWGAVAGGFWSKNILLAQADVGLIIPLLEIFRIEITTNEDMAFTVQRIVTALGSCVILGPRDGIILENTLKYLLQVPVLQFFNYCIRHYVSLNKISEPFRWEYKCEDFHLFRRTLTSNFKQRWLSVKEKKKKNTVTNEKSRSLETIHEDLETSNATKTTLTVEWAHQRLPLPAHWYLSPIIYSDSKNQGVIDDSIEIAKSGLFFILGIEIMTLFVPTEIQSPVRSVPLTWRLHSLSVSLLAGMALLEEDKTRDIYTTLQRVYGKLLDELLFSINKNKKSLAENGGRASFGLLRFESEIHESYSTFVENLAEQFAAESYGDEIYGRQISVYLHSCVDTPVRLAAWNTLSNARVLELLPPLENCIGNGEGYLEPAEDDESILEAYVKSWVSGALDKSKTRNSMAFILVLHHLSSFVFSLSTDGKFSLRNKIVTSLLRDYARNQKREGMIFDLIKYQKDGSVTKSYDDKIFLLAEACGRNSTLLHDLEKIRSSLQKMNSVASP